MEQMDPCLESTDSCRVTVIAAADVDGVGWDLVTVIIFEVSVEEVDADVVCLSVSAIKAAADVDGLLARALEVDGIACEVDVTDCDKEDPPPLSFSGSFSILSQGQTSSKLP